MTPQNIAPPLMMADKTSRDWSRILASYRSPNATRSLFELGVTLGPFILLWGVAWWALSVSYILALTLALMNGAFLLRLFAIQHDCGHGAFFNNRTLSDWTGRALGVLTLTPYDVWRRAHSVHHASSGNLDKRGMGDITTLTVKEYLALSSWRKFIYRLYRNPVVMFGIGPIYMFYLQNRLPFGFMKSGWPYWTSAMGTNIAIAVIVALVIYFGGLSALFLIFIPTTLFAASTGIWLFYVQHQFEDTIWDSEDDWELQDAALHGSSHYDLPVVLRWLTANIGIHHVHHLGSRIPFYRLTEVLRDHPGLASPNRMTFRQSLSCLKLHLWDENGHKLLSWRQVRALYGRS
mgnify:CR=1 FL=1